MSDNSPRLYFVTRDDLPGGEGRRAAQLIHAGQLWAARPGGAAHEGTVIVYSVPDEDSLLDTLEGLIEQGAQTVLWREPDLKDQATAFATDFGRMELPLLGRRPQRQQRDAA